MPSHSRVRAQPQRRYAPVVLAAVRPADDGLESMVGRHRHASERVGSRLATSSDKAWAPTPCRGRGHRSARRDRAICADSGQLDLGGWNGTQEFLLRAGQSDPTELQTSVEMNVLIDNSLAPDMNNFDGAAIRQPDAELFTVTSRSVIWWLVGIS